MKSTIFALTLFSLTLPAFGQQVFNPEEGIYVLNVAKSTFRGPAVKAQTLNIGKGIATIVGFNANGQPFTDTFLNASDTADGQSRPVKGLNFDAQSSTRLDPYTIRTLRTKDGKVTQTLIGLYNPDGKTYTVTFIGTIPDRQSFSHVLVFEKQ